MSSASTVAGSHDRRFYETLGEKESLYRYWTHGFGSHIHLARCRTLAEFLELSSEGNDSAPLLDMGCGDGAVTAWLIKKCWVRVVGCDISQRRIARAIVRAKRDCVFEKVDFVVCDISHLPFRKNSLPKIFSSEVLEHISQDKQVMAQVFMSLSVHGIFALTVPQEGSPLFGVRQRIWSPRLSGPLGGGYDIGHVNKYTVRSMRDKLIDEGFEVTGFRSIGVIIPFMPLHYLTLRVGPFFRVADRFGRRFPAVGDMLVFKAVKNSD